MDIKKAIAQRHSVRSYTNKKIDGEVKEKLINIIEECNKKSGLNIKLFLNEPKAFDTFMAHYGKFENVNNYIVLIGKKDKGTDEMCGYFGEEIVLKAQMLGLNTCWVALTYGKRKIPYDLKKDEKIYCTIAVGYGKTNGVKSKSKSIKEVVKNDDHMPDWFKDGIEAALLAPTATNQQKFIFDINEDKVSVHALKGFYSKLDLGIVKYHFEIGSNRKCFDI